MTLEQIKESIQFKEGLAEYGWIRLTATFGGSASIIVSSHCDDPSGAINHAKEHLREKLLRELYDSRRNEIAEACATLLRVSPMDHEGMRKAVNEIVKLARYIPKEGI